MAFELIKVSELPELTTPSDPNVIPIQDGDYLKRISFENLKEAVTDDVADDLAAEVTAREGAVSDEATARGNADTAILADLASPYSASATYAVGDYCTKDGQLYRCTTAITTAEAWTSGHWSAVALGDDTRDLRSALNDLTDITTELIYPINWWHDMGNGHYTKTGEYTETSYEKWCEFDVDEGDVLRLYQWQISSGVGSYAPKTNISWVCAYDTSGTPVSSAGSNAAVQSYTVPSGITKVILSINSSIVTKPLVSKNLDTPPTEQVTYFIPYYNQKTDKTLTQSNVAADAKTVGDKFANLKKENVEIVLPTLIYGAVGTELNLYHKNVLLADNVENYGIAWGMQGATSISKGYNECLRINPTAQTTVNYCKLQVFDSVTQEVLREHTFSVKVGAPIQSAKKAIFIGDSLTDAGYYVAEIAKNISNELIETLGSRQRTVTINDVQIPIRHEGRSGWSTTTYCTLASSGGITNAFWNPTSEEFDFSYYMQQQNYDSVDYVVIALGTNDIANLSSMNIDTVISNFTTMVNSIHAFDNNIKIVLSLPTPSAERNGWGNTSGRTGTPDRFDYYQKKLVDSMINTFSAVTNVILAPTYANLDTAHDFPYSDVAVSSRNPLIVSRQTDNVHPNLYGYFKIADAIWGAVCNG